ncbi:murein L,D-transpeptidase [Marinobacter litoralis]|uniref:Murein L,D-transpeptidase n=1 Tax=Marinobacter litoralis TaxID=187981 RepID=A0A3M2RG71_9GAMM|nr:L,D-transpeptidase family protein [Marinobacter litoralis]RMJ04159.1 murein L,D-transpeptidase [Marinobacter litoralis]
MQDATLSATKKSYLLIIMLLAFMQNAYSDDRIISRIEALQSGYPVTIGDSPLNARAALAQFYEARDYQPAWTSPAAQNELLKAINEISDEGLIPSDYHQEALRDIIQRSQDDTTPELPAELDLIFSDAFLLLGSHLLEGKVNPQTIDAEWTANRRQRQLHLVLAEALQSGQVYQTLQSLKPPAPAYHRLASYRRQLSALLGRPWPLHEAGPTIRPGDSDPRLPAIRQQLILLGDLPVPDNDSQHELGSSPVDQLYTGNLIQAIPTFQARHGLDPDGIIGRKTLAALNMMPIERIRQVDANLERWRWLPDSLGDTYVLVNIAGFDMVMVENGEEVLHQRVIVGGPFRQTPVFSDRIRYLVFNPTWTVPRTLMIQDQLPRIKSDPSYLKRMNFKVYKGWGANQVEIDPDEVNWASLSADNFSYQLVQQPGPTNSLGQVKFMFPNKHAVYLHDTPGQYHFSRLERTISSGCIRVERPFELAERLLIGNSRWNHDNISQARELKEPVNVVLNKPVPVHLQYWTTWVDKFGNLQIREDVYGRDRRLIDALRSDAQGNLQLTPRSKR